MFDKIGDGSRYLPNSAQHLNYCLLYLRSFKIPYRYLYQNETNQIEYQRNVITYKYIYYIIFYKGLLLCANTFDHGVILISNFFDLINFNRMYVRLYTVV